MIKIEMKRRKLLVNNIEKNFSDVFDYDYIINKKHNVVCDLRIKSNLKNEEILFINHSGRNYYIVGTDDWQCVLSTGYKIVAKNGIMEYMSQEKICSVLDLDIWNKNIYQTFV